VSIYTSPELQRIGVTCVPKWPSPEVCQYGTAQYLFSVNPQYDELDDNNTNDIVDVYLYTDPLGGRQSLVWATESTMKSESYASAELSVILNGALQGPKLNHGKPTNLYHLFVWIMVESGLNRFTYNVKS